VGCAGQSRRFPVGDLRWCSGVEGPTGDASGRSRTWRRGTRRGTEQRKQRYLRAPASGFMSPGTCGSAWWLGARQEGARSRADQHQSLAPRDHVAGPRDGGCGVQRQRENQETTQSLYGDRPCSPPRLCQVPSILSAARPHSPARRAAPGPPGAPLRGSVSPLRSSGAPPTVSSTAMDP